MHVLICYVEIGRGFCLLSCPTMFEKQSEGQADDVFS
jgi:ferredoxin